MIISGPVPKHAQLRALLEQRCATELSPGDLLPGERALEEEYGVSRITVRRAIGDLVAAGKLRRVRGKGTFVAPSPLVNRLHLASFSEEMRTQRVSATSIILRSALTPPPAPVASFFGTDPAVEHVQLQRLRLGDGEPYAVDHAWYNAELVPDLLDHDVERSVYALLDAQYGLPITESEQTVTATSATEAIAPLLDVAPATALLYIARYARSGALPVEYCASLYRSDRYWLTTRVGRESA